MSSIQAEFDKQALIKLPKCWSAIQAAAQFERDQMTSRALREIMHTRTALDDMDQEMITKLDNHLFDVFCLYEWTKE